MLRIPSFPARAFPSRFQLLYPHIQELSKHPNYFRRPGSPSSAKSRGALRGNKCLRPLCSVVGRVVHLSLTLNGHDLSSAVENADLEQESCQQVCGLRGLGSRLARCRHSKRRCRRYLRGRSAGQTCRDRPQIRIPSVQIYSAFRSRRKAGNW